jgi:hypothetical protein
MYDFLASGVKAVEGPEAESEDWRLQELSLALGL